MYRNAAGPVRAPADSAGGAPSLALGPGAEDTLAAPVQPADAKGRKPLTGAFLTWIFASGVIVGIIAGVATAIFLGVK